jgi:drug/metabolite transporter (DMT)-like permease
MWNYLAVVVGVGLIFTVYEVAMYGITAFILNRSPSLKNDFLWCLALAVPFALAEVLWLRAWRMAGNTNMSPWATDITYLVCAIIGSTIAMILFFKEVPSTTQIVGLILVVIGGLVAIWK